MRTVLVAAVASLLISILCTPLVVAWFRRQGFGQEIRDDGPQSHLVKRGTPTMGGVVDRRRDRARLPGRASGLILRSGAGPTASGLLLLYICVGMGFVGFLDDFIKLRRATQPRAAGPGQVRRPAHRRRQLRR